MNAKIGALVARDTAPGASAGRFRFGSRAWMALAATPLVVGAALNWSWLVAVGIAPILLALAPCAAMCAIGACAMRGSCQRDEASNPASQPGAPNLDGRVLSK